MAVLYVRCGTGIKSFVLHSASSSAYPVTITSKSYQYKSGFAAGSYDAYIDGIVYESGYGSARVATEWASSGTTGDWSILSDPYVATRSSEARYVEIYATKTATTKYNIKLQAGTGVSSFTYYYYSNGTYYGPMTSMSVTIPADYGTNVYISSVTASSTTYGAPYTMSDGSKTWEWDDDPYVYVSGARTITIGATKKETQKGSVTIDMGTGISSYTFTYYLEGVLYSSSSTASRRTIAADVGTDITITGFTYASANYDEPVTFSEYTSSTHTSLVTSWEYPDDPKIRIKSTARYFVFTASVKELTYYGRLKLNGNGGTFGSATYVYWPSVAQPASGIGGAYMTITLPLSTQTSGIPKRDGYAFIGWATSADGSVQYSSSEDVGFTAKSTYQSSPTEVSLYAVWSQTFTLKYETSYSSVTNMPDDMDGITSGTWVTISSKTPVLKGYTFMGWAKTQGGSVQLQPSGSIYITADTTLYTVFEKITIALFYWNGSDTADAAIIAKGQPVSNITAARWNSLLAKINELADASGANFSYTTVSSGETITAARFNVARTGLSSIKTALGASTSLPAVQSSGNTVYASLFNGSGSIKGSLNALIEVYNG